MHHNDGLKYVRIWFIQKELKNSIETRRNGEKEKDNEKKTQSGKQEEN